MSIETPDGEDLEVEITEETPENADSKAEVEIVEPEPKPKRGEKKAKTDDSVDEGLEKLKNQLDAEKARAAAAEKRANDAAQFAHQSKTEAQDANLHLITNAMDALESRNEILKANFRNAAQNQDFDAQAEIQMEMSTNAAKLARLEDGKRALEAAPKEEAPAPYVGDPVEALASQLSPRSAAWVRNHPEFATDPRKYQAMVAAHNLAVANGAEPDTDDYFGEIETSLRIRRNDVDMDDSSALSGASAPVQRRASPAAAPVSRDSPISGGNPNRVTLSYEEREMAEFMGMTVQEYAKNKLMLKKEGKLN